MTSPKLGSSAGDERAWDVVVLGAGILGSSTAWHLARRGMRVVVVERESQPGQGSTSRSTAIVRQRYSHPAAMALAFEGLRTWQRWSELVPPDAEGRRARLVRAGVLFLLPAGDAGTARIARDMNALGIAVEWLNRDQLEARFPALRFSQQEPVEGLLEPEGGYVDDPVRATEDVARAALEAGARFLFGLRVSEVVTTWEAGAPRVTGLRTSRGETLSCRAVVNCSGPHSGLVNLMARTPLGLTTAPLRQQVIQARAPRLADRLGRLPVIADLLNGFYLRPDPERVRVGAVWPQDERDWVSDPDAASEEIQPDYLEAKLAALARRVPGIELDQVRGLTGLYDVTVQDWYPIVDRTDTHGYFVAIGTSGAWFKAGPVIGWLASELVAAAFEGRDTDREPLVPTLPLTGHPFPLALLSRRRSPVALEYGGGVLG